MTDYNPGPATSDTPNISSEQILNTVYLSTNLPPATSVLPGTLAYTSDLGMMVSSGTAWSALVAAGTAGSAGVAKTGAATYAAARLLVGTTTGDTLYVFGRTTQSDGGQGLFTWVAGGTTTINDGIELTATGGIWRRAGIFLLDPTMLGLASFTFATLPTATQMVNMPQGIEVYTTDLGQYIWSGTAWTAVVTTIPTIVNLRQLGVTAATSAAFNTDAILAAMTQVGRGGTVVVPNFGASLVNHLGFTIPTDLTLTGENVKDFNTGAYGAGLQCIDNTALGIGTANGSTGLTISNLVIGGGFFGLRTGPSGNTTQQFALRNLHFVGPFGRSALAFAGHNEQGLVENLFIESVGANSYGIEWLNEPQGTAALASIFLDYVWVYGNSKVGVFLVNENPQQSIQGVEFKNLRVSQQRYCAVAVRAPCQGLFFSRGIGSESGNTAAPSGSKVDLFVDVNTYGAPGAITGTILSVAGNASSLGPPDFPILSRNMGLYLDMMPTGVLSTGVPTNSVGISRIFNDVNINGGAIVLGTDPGSGDSHLTSYLGNLGSNQPIFDNWPRMPMLDDTIMHQDLESAGDDDYQFLNAA